MNDIRDKLKQARTGYDAAIAAMPYMPKESRPYTQQTAEKYADEIAYLESLLTKQTTDQGRIS